MLPSSDGLLWKTSEEHLILLTGPKVLSWCFTRKTLYFHGNEDRVIHHRLTFPAYLGSG